MGTSCTSQPLAAQLLPWRHGARPDKLLLHLPAAQRQPNANQHLLLSCLGADRIASFNSLTGTLSNGWSTLSGLTRLDMLKNGFTGTLPDSWGSMSKLTELCAATVAGAAVAGC